MFGHFGLPITRESKSFNFRIEIFWSIIDLLQREHQMLPFSYVWNDPEADWWFDPRTKYSAIEGGQATLLRRFSIFDSHESQGCTVRYRESSSS